jgi:uncharacterized protein YgbK (DUF1537 family)
LIVVIADDFSGAAEMAGIGHRFGLTTEIQVQFNAHSNAQLIAIDSNTRSMSESSATRKIKELISEIKTADIQVRLFKKTDSVMRGHIAAELNALQQGLGYERVLFLPTNPVRGRIIRSGHYYVNEVSLDKTVFATDPDFPINSSAISTLLKPGSIQLPYVHIGRNNQLPAASFITADVETPSDIIHYVSNLTNKDLCSGAAECFEAFLQHLGYNNQGKTVPDPIKKRYTLIVNGSTVKNPADTALFKKFTIPEISLPGKWEGDQFVLNEPDKNNWHQSIAGLLHERLIVAVSINHPVNQIKGIPELFSGYFIDMMHYISKMFGTDAIHFCLTGGATASAIITSMGIQTLTVKQEVVPGVVTLSSGGKQIELFTVKPGSYPWPETLLKGLSTFLQ